MDLLTLLTAFECRISGGDDYLWSCFGPDSHSLDIGEDVAITFDRKTQRVYQVCYYGVTDDGDILPTSWIDPEYRDAYMAERSERGFGEDLEQFVETPEEVVAASHLLA